jgi:arginase family enzyme
MSDPAGARLFGAALDYLDDPERLGLKLAYVEAHAAGRLHPHLPRDPYDFIAPLVCSRLSGRARPFGKLELPGWLTPRPGPGERELIDGRRYRDFMDAGGPLLTARACGRIALEAAPDVPVMIGVDHGLTAGPAAALAGRLGPESLAVVILDSHFDAIPPALRAPAQNGAASWGKGLTGDFLAVMIEEGAVRPDRLFVIGVGDYPPEGEADSDFGRSYRSWIGQGVKVYPREESRDANFPERLIGDLLDTGARALYVSLDADVGACSCMSAVRFLDGVGLAEEEVLAVGRALGAVAGSGRMELAGADVCEVDVHLMGLNDEQGRTDRTGEICADFVCALFGG